MMPSKIRIAISGGGLAGASLLHALLGHPHLDVHIFESAPTFREAGIAVGIVRNAQSSLELIGPSAMKCLERAGAVPMRGVGFRMAIGKDQGCLVDQVEDTATRVTSIVQRAAFLRELLVGVDEERLHASKTLEKADQNDDGSLTLRFADGTTHECDILIGADGIRSTVRRFILGEDDPAVAPRNTGSWAVMTLQPYAKAQALIGSDLVNIDNAREWDWIGDGAFILHNVLSEGQYVQFVASVHDKNAEGSKEWRRTVTADEMKEIYKDWPPNMSKAVQELLFDKEPEQTAIYFWESLPARTYTSGAICVMGDAAHATSPWMASGAGMSIEDSMILSALLGSAETPLEAVTALKVYDQVRRPRTQRIVEASLRTGKIFNGRDEELGLDLEKLRKNLLPRWDFIIDFDVGKHRDVALETLKKELGKGDKETLL